MPSNKGEKIVIEEVQGYIQALTGTPEQAKATTPCGRKGGEQKTHEWRKPAEELTQYSTNPS